MSDVILPPATFRNQTHYRSIDGRAAPVDGCGFMLKPTARQGYARRVIRNKLIAVYVIRGSGTFTDWNQQHTRVTAGDMVLMPQGKEHGIQQDADGRWAEAYLSMDGRFGSELFRLGLLDAHLLHVGVDLPLIQRFEHILQDLQSLPDYALPALLGQALDLLSAASLLQRKRSVPGPQQHLIESACVLLSQDLDRSIDMEQLAARLNMTYERFRKLFRQRVGISPGSYRIRRKIDRAQALIWHHRLSNKEVAYQLGYPDPFSFSKQFRKVTGVWPDEYRRNLEGRR